MTEHAEQSTTQAGAAPDRIGLDDFFEAVTRGVLRALEAQSDVSGYAQLGGRSADQPGPSAPRFSIPGGTLTWGLIWQPDRDPGPGVPDLPGVQTMGGR